MPDKTVRTFGFRFLMFLLIVAAFSLALVIVSFLVPAWSEVALIAAPCAVAAVFLLLVQSQRGSDKSDAKMRAVIDGSNVMHWRNGEPCFTPLHDVVQELKTLGFDPGVIFDANAGHLLIGKYQDDDKLAKRLDLPEDAVVVVAKGSPADPIILAAARDLKAIVVTNDRYRDWAEDYPEVQEPGFLIRGGYKSGKLWLDGRIKEALEPSSPT
ncbi:hypothetical protein [Aliiroseovarius sp. F20344]|uniref:NYN domain-containing protein n=1 Tax=Aliiroseovarius sp. F20344 TaxID=2926414 RepID=UPI001FF5747A|nr:hypothetical protein [Aliiroseovarius sp. F20344]